MENRRITGIVLAGGKSSRMGTDKGLLEIEGKKMIRHVIDALTPNVSSIMIIANNDNYYDLCYPVIHDLIQDRGPMAGIYTGLVNSKTELNLVVACDIPFVTSAVLHALADASDDCDVVVPVRYGEQEPLCARYHRSVADKMKDELINGQLRMRALLKKLEVREMEMNEVSGFHPEQLVNINTPELFRHYNNAGIK